MANIDAMIAAAEVKAAEVRTITRADGSTVQGTRGSATVTVGDFQVYVISVGRRSSNRKEHYRATFYLRRGQRYVRVGRPVFAAAVASRYFTWEPGAGTIEHATLEAQRAHWATIQDNPRSRYWREWPGRMDG